MKKFKTKKVVAVVLARMRSSRLKKKCYEKLMVKDQLICL